MTATQIADEIQSQLLSAVQIAQETVVSTLEWVSGQAEALVPEATALLTSRLPEATHYLERGFEAAEQWLRSQRDFVTKVADAVKPSA
jgi:hypothetical protein